MSIAAQQPAGDMEVAGGVERCLLYARGLLVHLNASHYRYLGIGMPHQSIALHTRTFVVLHACIRLAWDGSYQDHGLTKATALRLLFVASAFWIVS